jgi:arylsulfatase A
MNRFYTSKNSISCTFLSLLVAALLSFPVFAQKKQKPNVIFIYADDLGYGDLSSYGATKINTPNIDRLAKEGLKFTNAHSTSATCTPSRFALMTGTYPWRKKGTGVLPGNASLIIPTDKITLPLVFKNAGYKTGIVGKWHLGLGSPGKEINWNKPLKVGPNEIGFDYAYFFPATSDRVPTVFIENHDIVGYDQEDPIEVNYLEQVGKEPTGKEHPELLKLQASPGHGHNQTIVNGIGRIGFMSGGKQARWADEEIAHVFLNKAEQFIEDNQKNPFFLYFSLNDIHVPRMPSTEFKGKSKMGLRGDVILQMDWTVGEILKKLEALGLEDNTMVIFSSDNGPVLDDGYADKAVESAAGHKPAGLLRGGKYSAFEGGSRVPWLVRWPAAIKPATLSNALICQIDLLSSFARFFQQPLEGTDATDSFDMMEVLLGKSKTGRESLVKQGGALSLTKGNWKYIEPDNNQPFNKLTGTELGNDTKPQLYDLSKDPGERNNLAGQYPNKVKLMAQELLVIKEAGGSR